MSSTTPTNIPNLPKFKGEAYQLWSKTAKAYFCQEGLWPFIAKPEPKPTELEEARAWTALMALVDFDYAKKFPRASTANELWAAIEKTHFAKDSYSVDTAVSEFWAVKLGGHGSMAAYLSAIEEKVARLSQTDKALPEATVCFKIIDGLEPVSEYAPFIQSWKGRGREAWTVEELSKSLLSLPKVSSKRELALAAKADVPPAPCKFCKGLHWHSQCEKAPLCPSCNRRGHTKDKCIKRNKDPPSSLYSAPWIVDSGASVHMTGDARELADIKAHVGSTIETSNGELLTSQAIGKSVQNPIIDGVQLVPGLRFNLLSTIAATDEGFKVLMEGDTCIFEKDGQILLKATKNPEHGGLFTIESIKPHEKCLLSKSDSVVEKKATLQEWHTRLAHLHPSGILALERDKLVSGLKITQKNWSACLECAASKMPRCPQSRESSRIPEAIGDIVSADIVGPISPPCRGGGRYISCITDHFSGYTDVRILSHKSGSNILEHLKYFLAFVTTQTGKVVKILRTDNGTEYDNEDIRRLIAKRGIRHELTAPYNPQGNGRSERQNRTIIEAMRTLMKSSNMPPEFWGHATIFAAYTQLRTLSSSHTKKTYFEGFYDYLPDVSYLQSFGQKCFVYDESQKSKLADRAAPGRLLGYSSLDSPIYEVLLDSGQIVKSRNVKFLEGNAFSNALLRTDNSVQDPVIVNSLSGRSEENDSNAQLTFSVGQNANNLNIISTSNDNVSFTEFAALEEQNASSANQNGYEEIIVEERPPENTINHMPPSEEEVENTSPVNHNGHDETIEEETPPWDTINHMPSWEEEDDADNSRLLAPLAFNPDNSCDVDKDLNIGINHSSNQANMGELSPEPPLTPTNNITSTFSPRTSSRNTRYKGHFRGLLSREITSDTPTYKEGLEGTDSEKWKKAILEELNSLKANETFDIVPRPQGRRIVGSKFVFRIKRDSEGHILRYKARLVAQGFTQQEGIDFTETFAPVAGINTILVLLSIAASCNWHIHQMDFDTAYLNAPLTEEVYMEAPLELLPVTGSKEKVLKLKKALYGLKQSGHEWNKLLTRTLKSKKWTPNEYDQCLFSRDTPSGRCHIIVYVDDILIFGNSNTEIANIKAELQSMFPAKDQGEAKNILGFEIERNRNNRTLYIRQKSLIARYLTELNLEMFVKVATPLPANYFPKENVAKASVADVRLYQGMIGRLLYLSRCTRPDIAAAVNRMSRVSANPSENHLHMVKRIFQYIHGTMDRALRLGGEINEILAYTDSDFASDLKDRCSTSGRVIFLGKGPVSWSSTKQKNVTTSTKEAEYVAASGCVKNILWIKGLLHTLSLTLPARMLCDCKPAVHCILNGESNADISKHVDVKYHHIRQRIQSGEVSLHLVSSVQNVADIFTKPLGKNIHHNHSQTLGLLPIWPNRRSVNEMSTPID